MTRDLLVDLFAGGGGASLGIEWAMGRAPDIAVNHSHAALAMHAANHPGTMHLCEDVFDVEPREVVGRNRVVGLWASPDCTHHSKAKGAAPRSARRRALATIMLKWAAQCPHLKVMGMENVEEFEDWGPLDANGYPIRELAGRSFDAFVADLELQGFEVDWRLLTACDYGSPTTRRRLFLMARRDGKPIVWPEPTFGPGRAQPWRTAASIIDWSIPSLSIFATSTQAKAWSRAMRLDAPPKRPLAPATMRRIARGLKKFVIDAPKPFIVKYYGTGGAVSVDEPMDTVTTRARFGLVAPTLVQTGYGERPGQAPRCLDLHEPLGTVVACGAKHALVSAFLSKQYGGHEGPGSSLERPIDTVTCIDHHALAAVHLTKFYGTATGADAGAPMPTVTTGGGKGGGHIAAVLAFLREHHGADATNVVRVDDVPHIIADIGLRMLQPRELFRAQGFPDSYVIDPELDGKPLTKTEQTSMAGNSAPPHVVAALWAANMATVARRSA